MATAPRPFGLFPEASEIPADIDLTTPLAERRYLLGGAVTAWDGAMQAVTSPIEVASNGGLARKVLGECPVLDAACAEQAVAAADAAWDDGRGKWPTMRVEERIECVADFAARMVERRAEIIRLLVWEICKSRADAAAEFDRTVAYIKATVDALKDLDRASSRFVIEEGLYAQIRRAPLGPVLCMGPFNYPLNETFTTLIPALIMGNPVIVKTPRLGKLLYAPLSEAFAAAFPPGVVSVLWGDRRLITPIMASGKINVLAFIGSSTAADALRLLHPQPHRLRCVLGLDAKNAAIVLPSADLDLTVEELLAGCLAFNGQRCTAIKMVFVHDSLAEALLARLDAGIRRLPMGLPWADRVKITPLPVPGKVDYLRGLAEEAVGLGAAIANTGGGTHAGGLFHPTMLFPVDARMRVWHEEQFGPVIPVAAFTDLATPMEYVFGSNYGQQLSIFGQDPDAVAGLIDPMVNQVCRVNVNSQCQRGPDSFPFTGRKDSAEGTLSVTDALRCFSIRTLVAARGTAGNKALLSAILKQRKSHFLSTDFLL